jgi:hypothetical protein
VRFGDFLKAAVLLSGGAATLLAALTVIGVSRDFDPLLAPVAAGWWVVAALIGIRLGRRAETTPPIARLLATARTQTTLPELRPGLTLINRLWPLLLYTMVAAGVGIFLPPVAAITGGGAMIWALAWRRQESAVAAIEERDGVRFYVDKTSPFLPMRLIRTPGFGGSYLADAH